MIAQAVGLDHEPEVGPEEVDPESVQTYRRVERRRQARVDGRSAGSGARARSQSGGRCRDRAGQRSTRPPRLGRGGRLRARAQHSSGSISSTPVGLVDRAPRALRRRGSVARSISVAATAVHRDPVALEHLGGQSAPAVNPNAGQAWGAVGRDRDLDHAALAADSEHGGGAAVAQRGPRPAGEHRRHPAAVTRERRTADGVDAAPDAMQPPVRDSTTRCPPARHPARAAGGG